jgi:hypothetical protein
MAKKKYHVRKFLNKNNGMAAIEISAGYSAWNFDCNVSLSDCNRRIDLDFTMWGAKNIKEKMDKLNLIINELNSLKAYLEVSTEDFLLINKKVNKDKGNKSILSVLENEEDD